MTASQSAHHRRVVANAKRVVVKAGSSSLAQADGHLDSDRVDRLAGVISERRAVGQHVVLVSSGAIASGVGPLGLDRIPTDIATAQAAASVGQGELVGAYSLAFRRRGLVVGQVLLTAHDFWRRAHYRNAQRALDRLLDLGVIPVVNENDAVATDEIRMGDNDRLAALVAHLVRADALVLLSDVDALYDLPPGQPGAQVITTVESARQLDEVEVRGPGSPLGSGGMRTKIEAAEIATAAGIPVVLASADLAAAALAGEPTGTLFKPTGRRRSSRLLWLAHATESCGSIVIDEGAVRAVRDRGASLLPAGVIMARGDFVAGDAVDIVSEDGRAVARGIVSYDATEIPALIGRSTHELAADLGSGYERELVHRDDLVVREP